MNLQLETFSHQNRFRNIPALYKLLFTFLLGAITYLSHIQVQVIIFIGVFAFLVGIVHIPMVFVIRWLLLPFAFMVLSIPAIVLGMTSVFEQSNDIFFTLYKLGEWQLYISKSGLFLAYSTLSRAISLFICIFALLITTPFHQILQALDKLRVPQVLLDLLISMYRFIFILLENVNELTMVVKSRQGNITKSRTLYSVGLVIVQLFVQTFEKYKRVTLVLESRGFNGQLYYKDVNSETAVPKAVLCYGMVIVVFLIGVEWWCRSS